MTHNPHSLMLGVHGIEANLMKDCPQPVLDLLKHPDVLAIGFTLRVYSAQREALFVSGSHLCVQGLNGPEWYWKWSDINTIPGAAIALLSLFHSTFLNAYSFLDAAEGISSNIDGGQDFSVTMLPSGQFIIGVCDPGIAIEQEVHELASILEDPDDDDLAFVFGPGGFPGYKLATLLYDTSEKSAHATIPQLLHMQQGIAEWKATLTRNDGLAFLADLEYTLPDVPWP